MRKEKGISLVSFIIAFILIFVIGAIAIVLVMTNDRDENDEIAIKDSDIEAELSIDNNEDSIAELPEGWRIATDNERTTAWPDETVKNENVIAITDEINIIPLPQGYGISTKKGENTISEGLVISDTNGNEFVWIPVPADFETTYNYGSNYSEPTTVSFDTQANLDKYYGTNYYTIEDSDEYKNNKENTFAYHAHYEEMVECVNKYNGFYIGRYETTIDGASIGSEKNATVLTSATILKEGTNRNDSDNPYYYRWWGLYESQRNSNVIGNGDYIQTNMIWGQQWDAMIEYFENLSIDYSALTTYETATSVVNSGQAQYILSTGETVSDKIYNIFDLRRNAKDWTAEATFGFGRLYRGGDYLKSHSASSRSGYDLQPDYSGIMSDYGVR